MQHSEAMAFLVRLNVGFPTFTLPEATAETWATLLERYETADAWEALPLLIEESRFFPSFADIVAEVRRQRNARTRKEIVALPEPEGITLSQYLEDHGLEPGWRPWDASAPK